MAHSLQMQNIRCTGSRVHVPWSMDLWRCSAAQSCANNPKRRDQQRQQRYWFIAVAFHSFVVVVIAIGLLPVCSIVLFYCTANTYFVSAISMVFKSHSSPEVACQPAPWISTLSQK